MSIHDSIIDRDRDRILARDRILDRDGYPVQGLVAGGVPVEYTQRTVRRVIPLQREHDFHHSSSFFDNISWSKLLLSGLVLGLAFSMLMPSRDVDLFHRRGMLGDISDRVSDGISSIGDRIYHKPTMTERLYDKTRLGAWDAKDKVVDGLSSISDSAAAARDKVSDGLSYLGDKMTPSRSSRGILRHAKDRAYDLGRDVQDRAYDLKDRLYDDDDYDYVRRPMRRLRKYRSSSWSPIDMIRMHPWLSTMLGLVLFFALKNMFSSKTRYTNRSGLTGLALLMDRFGVWLSNLGGKVRDADNFSDWRSGSEYNRGQYTRTSDFDRSGDFRRSHIDHSNDNDFHRSSDLSSSRPHVSSYGYVPRDSTFDVNSSHLSSDVNRPSHISDINRSNISYDVNRNTVPNVPVTNTMSSGVSSSGLKSSDMLGHVAPEQNTVSVTSSTTIPAWNGKTDSSLVNKAKQELTKDNLNVIHKAEVQRPILGGK